MVLITHGKKAGRVVVSLTLFFLFVVFHFVDALAGFYLF